MTKAAFAAEDDFTFDQSEGGFLKGFPENENRRSDKQVIAAVSKPNTKTMNELLLAKSRPTMKG